MLPLSLKPVAAALGGLAVAFCVGLGLVRLSPVPSPDPLTAGGDNGPSFTVAEAMAEIVTMARPQPPATTKLAAAILAAAHDSHQSVAADENDWMKAHEGAYIQIRFDRLPLVPVGADRTPVPVSQVVFGFRPVQIVAKSGSGYYQFRAPSHASLVRVQRLMADLAPMGAVTTDDADKTYDRLIGAESDD